MLPILYTGGFVMASALQRARRGRTRFYHSCIPDVYSTMALSLVMPEYVYSWEPVALSGLSAHSTGRAQFTMRDDADQRAAVTFLQEGNIPFHRDIPLDEDGHYPKSMQAMVYESFLQVADIEPEPRLLPRERQLVVVLATAPPQHENRIRAWAQRFASQHGLSFDAAAASARWYRLRLKARNLPAAMTAAYRLHTMGSESLPLTDIDEACLAAGIALDLKPSRVGNALRKIRRRLDGTRARERKQSLL
jgi:hypothetical protein